MKNIDHKRLQVIHAKNHTQNYITAQPNFGKHLEPKYLRKNLKTKMKKIYLKLRIKKNLHL